jgi:hypothetical protein
MLLEAIDDISLQVVRDLQLLTFGAQLRGGQNTQVGQKANVAVFSIIEDIVRPYVRTQTARKIELENESGRVVVVTFSNDPDVAISEALPSGDRALVAIEVKGGADISNIHNRIGEAEKSHQKAKSRGFLKFWTILGANVDLHMARRESPTTTRFYRLSQLGDVSYEEYRSFREHLQSIVGIRGT